MDLASGLPFSVKEGLRACLSLDIMFAIANGKDCVHMSTGLRSVPGWRETRRGEKISRYIDFKQFRLCAHIDIFHSSI